MTTDTTANGLRRAQVGNLRKEWGYGQVYVDVQLHDDRGTPYPVLGCSIMVTPDGELHSGILGGCTSRYAPTAWDWSEMRSYVDRFIQKNEDAIRATHAQVLR